VAVFVIYQEAQIFLYFPRHVRKRDDGVAVFVIYQEAQIFLHFPRQVRKRDDGEAVYLHAMLKLAPDGSKWLISHRCRFTTMERAFHPQSATQ
jgi:hypothetical protein